MPKTMIDRFQPTRNTPWGRSDSQKELADGIWMVTTPSHGGVKLSPERQAQMPDYMARTQRRRSPTSQNRARKVIENAWHIEAFKSPYHSERFKRFMAEKK